jgi:hypothetical protein
MIKKSLLLGAAMIAGIGAAALPQAPANADVRVGTLTCHVSPGVGFIIGSSRDVRCDFAGNRYMERYVGSMSKLGVDIGFTNGGTIVWNVIAPASDLGPGVLEGTYAGATAGATLGIGVGAHVLLGGFNRSIALQPISVEGNQGLNVAAGIGQLNLQFARF